LTSWIPGGSVGEWLSFAFPEREVGSIVVDTATNPEFTQVVRIRADFSDGTSVAAERTDLADGTLRLQFPPRTVDGVRLTITRVLTALGPDRPAGAPERPVAIAEVRIPGLDPLQVSDQDPIPCTTDASFTLDGTPVPVRADGTVGDLLDGRVLDVAPCTGLHLDLDAGWHALRIDGHWSADTIRLATGPEPVPGDPSGLPRVEARSRPGGAYDVSVEGAGSPYYLVISQNYDPGWTASVEGQDLGPPVLVDGYSAGWLVSRPGSYTVEVRYGPQRRYFLAPAVTGVFLVAAVWILAVGGLRRRRARRRAA
jgi:arabinofuranan 3-O-arabinosyltransferase